MISFEPGVIGLHHDGATVFYETEENEGRLDTAIFLFTSFRRSRRAKRKP